MSGAGGLIPKDAREVYLNESGEPIAYCPVDSLGLTDLEREQFFSMQDHRRLAELAERARARREETGSPFVVVCIHVDDPVWRPLVDILMPDHDWQAYRDRGEIPVARGVVPRALIAQVIADVYPAAGLLAEDDTINIVVLASGGAAIHVAKE